MKQTPKEMIAVVIKESRMAKGYTQMAFGKMNVPQRSILSVGISLFMFFLSWAFIAQSAWFPETSFELLVFVCVMLLLTTGILWLIWNKK